MIQSRAGSASTNVSTVSAHGQPPSELDHRANDLTSTLKEILTQTDAAQHWGINE